ncbi:class I SAM-dependent methyltransferase [Amycolatopsis acididurans]|uniref:class I SAM-dependent methyltransferase n=1 Tax=Amycolatopsis acididurans TaxID=2724524 RepID=UPI0028ABB7C1|nr:class I SAM-dependent methyltransferase [Amycolatopsis acididurans]
MRHPVFARLYPRIAAAGEAAGAAEHRDELLAGVTGRVIEVGSGHGINFAHYPETVTEVVAIEPEPSLRARAEEAAREAPVPVTVIEGTAEQLPGEDEAFDVAVTSLVLCSVRDADAALREVRRVLRPGGELRFYEHIRAGQPGFVRYQKIVNVVWPLIAGGCQLVRATDVSISAAGFTVEKSRYFRFPAPGVPASPHVLGLARRAP